MKFPKVSKKKQQISSEKYAARIKKYLSKVSQKLN